MSTPTKQRNTKPKIGVYVTLTQAQDAALKQSAASESRTKSSQAKHLMLRGAQADGLAL